MKRTTVLVAGLATGVLLAACAPNAGPADQQADPPESSERDVTLRVWSWQVDMAERWEEVFAVYEDQNPGVTVEFRGYPGTEYPTVLRTGLSDSSGPDIVMMHPYASLLPYVSAGQLEPIDPASIPELSNFTDESLEAARVDGELYGVPFAQQTIQVFYNRTIFEDLGLEPPQTREDVQPMLDTLVDAGITPFSITGRDTWQLVNVFDALVGTTYGHRDFVDAVTSGEAEFTDPAFVDALAEFEALIPYFPDLVTGVEYADSQTLFHTGRAAMFPGGSWELGGFRAADPDLDVGVFSMPAEDGSRPTFGYEDGSLALSARSANKEEALELLRWTSTPEFGELFTENLSQMSSVVGVEPADPVLGEMMANYAADPVPMMWVTHYFSVNLPAPYAALMEATQGLLLGEVDPESAAASVEENRVAWDAQLAEQE